MREFFLNPGHAGGAGGAGGRAMKNGGAGSAGSAAGAAERFQKMFWKSAEALSLRACRSPGQAINQLIKSTNPPINPRVGGFMPPPTPPPQLRPAQSLAVLPGEVT